VVEPPSRRLQQILLGLKLCSPRDLRRCASRVKALSADLPAFDSVWLDALVQRRLLTSWQAQTIEAEQPELLRIGPCVVE
jgi:eukaryotic-like serine/threonine-protein kinase